MPGPAGTERASLDTPIFVGVAALVGGAVAAFGPAAPTGRPGIDAVLCGVGVAIVVAIGSRAPWWAAVVAAAVAMAIAFDPLLVAIAAAALALALVAGWRARPSPALLAASLAVTFNVAARAELGGMLGTSAIATLAAGLALYVLGTLRLPRRLRWLSLGGLGAVLLFAAAATAGLAHAAATSRHDLASGLTTAELGVAAMEGGQFDAAISWFEKAERHLDAANANLDRPWVRLASLVPVVAQHEAAAQDMGHAGADGARTVIAALDEIDFDELRPTGGRFDLEALAGLETPLRRVRAALVRLRDTAEAAQSPWLVRRATSELDEFTSSVDEHLPDLDDALRAIGLAPAMLGADGPRTYLLLFTTPSEARGLGGFIGSYAELRIDDGQVSLGGFDRSTYLDQQVQAAGARVRGQDEFLRQYGRFGYDEDGSGTGVVADASFRNLALTPDFSTVAEIGADLYVQATGTKVDGVIAMDPFVVTALLRYTGPVTITSAAREIGPDEALQFLLRDQYVLTPDFVERSDGLAEAASQAFDGLVGGALPGPIELAQDLGPLTGERRLLVWSADPDEQDLIETVDIGGAVPSIDGADGWSFTVSNAGGSKIDSFLERRAGYESSTDEGSGVTTGTMRIELTNGAPAEGLPDYVIGNFLGKPTGTSSLLVTLYTPLGLDGITLDGEPVRIEVGDEHGWNTYRLTVDIPPGATVRLEAQLSGTVERPGEVVTWTQPLANDLQLL